MAVKLQSKRDLSSVHLIARCDDALAEDSGYDRYIKTGDEALLKIREGATPTRFILNFAFSGKASERIKNAMIGAGGGEEDGVKMNYGSWTFAVAKMALKEIVNPPDLGLESCIVMRRDDRQLVHDDLLGQLDRFGIVQDIFSLYQNLVLTPERSEAKNS